MRWFFIKGWKYRYTPLNSGIESNQLFSNSTWSSAVNTFLICLLLGVAFLVGARWASTTTRSEPDLNTIFQVFRYDRTYGDRPSNKSDEAWHALFPEQGGFFRHPKLAPKRSALAVYHQLHCLDGIRRGYWAVYDAAIEGRRLVADDLPFMSSPSHIRHCIDLLRHSLMCQPDTTVEVKDEIKGGVSGFGTEHRCSDWGQLIDWTSKWEIWMQDPRARKQTHDHRHTHAKHGR